MVRAVSKEWETLAHPTRIFLKSCKHCIEHGLICCMTKTKKEAPCAFCKFNKRRCDAVPVDENSEDEEDFSLPPPLDTLMSVQDYKCEFGGAGGLRRRGADFDSSSAANANKFGGGGGKMVLARRATVSSPALREPITVSAGGNVPSDTLPQWEAFLSDNPSDRYLQVERSIDAKARGLAASLFSAVQNAADAERAADLTGLLHFALKAHKGGISSADVEEGLYFREKRLAKRRRIEESPEVVPTPAASSSAAEPERVVEDGEVGEANGNDKENTNDN